MRLTSGYFKNAQKYKIGPGGPFCPCCTKLRPETMKIKVRRLLRRKEKQNISLDLSPEMC